MVEIVGDAVEATEFGCNGVSPQAQSAAATAAETTLTNAGTGGDAAIQALINASPFGFVTAAEGEQVVETALNNQARIAEIITVLQKFGFTA